MDKQQSSSDISIDGNVGAGAAVGPNARVEADIIVGRDLIIQAPPSEREQRLKLLRQVLKGKVADLQKSVQASTDSPSLLPGLRPYKLTENRFFKREQLTSTLFERVAAPGGFRTLILHGRAGVGKSSLVQAGLQPHLIQRGYLPFYIRLRPKTTPDVLFYDQFPQEARPADTLLHTLAWMQQQTAQRLYLIVDQFEELLGNEDGNKQPVQFVNHLVNCLENENLDVFFVLVVRSEQYFGLNMFKKEIPTIFDNELEVPLLTTAEALDAVATFFPTDSFISPDLHQIITGDLNQQGVGVDPTQLQIICDYLWQKHQTDPTPLLESYQNIGGHQGILRHYLQNLLKRHVPPQQRPVGQTVLVSLLPSEPKTKGQLAEKLGSDFELGNTLDNLAQLDLIRADADANGEKRYSIAQNYIREIIQQDPVTIEQIRAEELLEAGLREYQRFNVPLSEQRYQFIKQCQENGGLVITASVMPLWQRSRRASALRHLMFRLLLTALLGMLISIPVLGFNMLIYPPTAPRSGIYAFVALAAALAGALSNGLGAAALTGLDYYALHWSRLKRFWPFLLLQAVPGLMLGGLLFLLYATGWFNFRWPGEGLSTALLLSLFIGTALFWSLPTRPATSWRSRMLPSLMVGTIAGMLLAVIVLLVDWSSGSTLNQFQRNILYLEFIVYLITLTTTFNFGLSIADQLLSSRPT